MVSIASSISIYHFFNPAFNKFVYSIIDERKVPTAQDELVGND